MNKNDRDNRAGEADIDGLVCHHESERGKLPGNAVLLLLASWLAYIVAAVVLLSAPFFAWATLLNAMYFFVIGACISVFYRANVADDMKTRHARYVMQSRLLREIRDAIRDR